jgi:hypothetical protein
MNHYASPLTMKTLTLALSLWAFIITHNPPGWEVGALTWWVVVQNEAA